jgi:hypothetical protein
MVWLFYHPEKIWSYITIRILADRLDPRTALRIQTSRDMCKRIAGVLSTVNMFRHLKMST